MLVLLMKMGDFGVLTDLVTYGNNIMLDCRKINSGRKKAMIVIAFYYL